MGRRLYYLPQSPWSEKARWALDHHHVAYDAIEYLPVLMEPLLRVMSRQPGRRVTVPMLFDGRQVLRDSVEIGQHADRVGKGTPLFARETEVLAINDLTETMMHVARIRVLVRLRDADGALAESLPPPLRALPALTVPTARAITDRLIDKYRGRGLPAAESESIITATLDQLEALRGGREHMVGDDFTFADIAVACAAGFLVPHARAPLGPENRRVFTEPAIAAAYPELLAWRDRVVDRYR